MYLPPLLAITTSGILYVIGCFLIRNSFIQSVFIQTLICDLSVVSFTYVIYVSNWNKCVTLTSICLDTRYTLCYIHFYKPPRYGWNIVENGVKHHKPNQPITSTTNIMF